mmetsp:Transcript_53253/g.155105  ORF Transcript_53253/g.155105 Transcript_53253/m.155105 type:complete len:754 (-) Transcript_53253:69-2330(-)
MFDFGLLESQLPPAKALASAAPPKSSRSVAVPSDEQPLLLDEEGQCSVEPDVLEGLAGHFATDGWLRVPKLGVPRQCCSKVQLEVDMLQNPRQAERIVGEALTKEEDGQVRTDSTLFLDFLSLPEVRLQLKGLAKLDEIVEHVVLQLADHLRGPPLRLHLRSRSNMMLSCHEPGGYHLPHSDADAGGDSVIAATYYLNPGWCTEDGGAQRLHLAEMQQIDIWPSEDSLVLLRSDQVRQEVCLTHARRLAVTIWFQGTLNSVQSDNDGGMPKTLPRQTVRLKHRGEWPGKQGSRLVWPPQGGSPSIWWGDGASAEQLGYWQRQREQEGLARITHVCNTAALTVPLPAEQRLGDVTYLTLEMMDVPFASGTEVWAKTQCDLRVATAFMEEALSKDGVILVNCRAGHNRSAAVLLAWMLTHRPTATEGKFGFSPIGAMQHLRRINPWCMRNASLRRCSLDFAGAQPELCDSDSGDDASGARDAPQREPVLVCWNIVGFRLKEGTEKLAGLFVAAKQLGIKDHVMLSYPEDYGVKGEGDETWATYVDRLIEKIDRSPRRLGRPLLLFAHSNASGAALSVAVRLGARVLKIYLVDGPAPRPEYDVFAVSHASFKSFTDADWVQKLYSWNPGSSVLREMAKACTVEGWEVSKSPGAQEILEHGRRMYINAVYPKVGRDLTSIPSPILAFKMIEDVIDLASVAALQLWTTGGFDLVRVECTHVGWLLPTRDLTTKTRRYVVFDLLCEDIQKNLDHWMSLV